MDACPGGFRGCPGHLVLGLGNPGPRYEATRHNVGFRVIDRLLAFLAAVEPHPCGHGWAVRGQLGGSEGHRVWLAKPLGYMNRSGVAAAELVGASRTPLNHLVVVHDDLDLPWGRLRIRLGGGHGGHNGVRSVVDILGTGEFGRLKVGIGRPEVRGTEADYVLDPFAAAEEAALPSLLDRAAAAVGVMISEGPWRAMNCLHSQPADTGGSHGKPD